MSYLIIIDSDKKKEKNAGKTTPKEKQQKAPEKEYKLASTTQSTDYRKKAIASAEDIVRYIEKGDAANAVRCMRRHLDLTKYAIINLNV